MSTRPVTELDFDKLKAEIITFIKGNTAFSDYNFEGSALNAVADLLAFNTHSNAFYANMLHSEGFLDTAQKRASAVSRAKELGYTPRSAVCSTAYLNITATQSTIDTQFNLLRGTAFTSANDNGSHNFFATESVASTVNGSNHVFNNVKIVAGTPAFNYFKVDTLSNIRSLFTIPSELIDTSTLKVFVRDSNTAIERVEYFLAKNVFELNSESRVYFLQESYDGSFQIFFGDNIIGKQPVNGNSIDVDYYIADSGSLSDTCRVFGFDGTIGNSPSISIVTSQVSFGGSAKESLEIIKYNATKSNSAKSRAVTAPDYALRLREDFNFINTVSVWGGEDNVPAVYGKVFISIQPVSGYTISDEIKRDVITPTIRKNSMMTIGIEYVDPTYLEMYFNTKVKFAATKTLSSKSEIEAMIKTTIANYISSISTFNKDYLESSLIAKITAADPGIQSINLSKNVGFKLTPLLGIETSHNKTVFNSVKVGSVSSSLFVTVWGGVTEIVSILETGTLDSLGNHKLGLYKTDGTLIRTIGFVSLETGKFNFTLNVNSYLSDSRYVAVQFSLVSDDVTTSRNQILKMARSIESSSGLNYNTVVAETYDK